MKIWTVVNTAEDGGINARSFTFVTEARNHYDSYFAPGAVYEGETFDSIQNNGCNLTIVESEIDDEAVLLTFWDGEEDNDGQKVIYFGECNDEEDFGPFDDEEDVQHED